MRSMSDYFHGLSFDIMLFGRSSHGYNWVRMWNWLRDPVDPTSSIIDYSR